MVQLEVTTMRNNDHSSGYGRSLSEQIRDLYFDAVTDMIFSSNYKGRIRFLADTELDTYLLRKEVEGTAVYHLLQPTPLALSTMLEVASKVETPLINIYFSTLADHAEGVYLC